MMLPLENEWYIPGCFGCARGQCWLQKVTTQCRTPRTYLRNVRRGIIHDIEVRYYLVVIPYQFI